MFRKTAIGAAALLMAAAALAGCSTVAGGGLEGVRESPDPSGALEVDAAWLDGGSTIAVVTQGSSTCPPHAGDVSLESGVLRVDLVDPAAGTGCTRDFVPRGTAVGLPEGIDLTEDLTIEVTSAGAQGEVVLPAAPGLVPADGPPDYDVPRAGWTTSDGTFALLTWGSSSCTPTVQDAAVTAPGEITVTLATPHAERACTADLAPQVAVIAVADADAEDAYELVLQGDGFAGTRLPIISAG